MSIRLTTGTCLDIKPGQFYESAMQKVALLFFILLTLVMMRAYSQETKTATNETEDYNYEDVADNEFVDAGQLQSNSAKIPASPLFKELPSLHYAAVRFEPYQPLGHANYVDQSSLELSSIGQTILPTLVYGFLSPTSNLGEFQTAYGLETSLSYASQAANFSSSSGLVASGQFQTEVLSLKPMMRFHWRSRQRIFTRVTTEVGYEQVNLSTSGNISSFSRNSGFVGYGVGLEWDPFQNYGLNLDYFSRIGTSTESGWSPAASSYQFGALVYF